MSAPPRQRPPPRPDPHRYDAELPKLADAQPFYLLDPSTLTLPPTEAATMRAAAAHAPRVAIDELQPIDLVVCGSVAVNCRGDRIGKGAGYFDLEDALLHDAGLLGPDTIISTTVHPLQVLNEDLPATSHDFQLDYRDRAPVVRGSSSQRIPVRRRDGLQAMSSLGVTLRYLYRPSLSVRDTRLSRKSLASL